jgi:hypothetical protein
VNSAEILDVLTGTLGWPLLIVAIGAVVAWLAA